MDRPLCIECNKNLAAKQGRPGAYYKRCDRCRRSPKSFEVKNKNRRAKQELKRRPWLEFRKDFCEACGFVAVHLCQLDVDHIDGNSKNNQPKNFQTLCANCHRLKTWKFKDWSKDPDRGVNVAILVETVTAHVE